MRHISSINSKNQTLSKKEKECEALREQKENAQATIDIGAS